MKPFIFMAELAAGGRHFRNYRQFISIRGLPTLIDECKLNRQDSRIVAGGCLALHLVQVREKPRRQ